MNEKELIEAAQVAAILMCVGGIVALTECLTKAALKAAGHWGCHEQ